MADVRLGFRRVSQDETWRAAVQRIASAAGLEAECLEDYDQLVSCGVNEKQAAWDALWEWDCLEVVGG